MNEFEKYTRDTLNNHPSPVDTERLWGNIDRELRPGKRRLAPFWVWGLGLAALAGGILFVLNGKKAIPPAPASERSSVAGNTGAPRRDENTAAGANGDAVLWWQNSGVDFVGMDRREEGSSTLPPSPLRRGGMGARPHFTHPSRFGMPNVDRGQAPLPFGGEPVPYFSREDGGGVETSGGPSNLTLIAMEDGGGVETPGEPLDLELMALKAGGEVSRTKSDTPPLQSIPLSPIHPHKNRIRLTAGLANGVFFSARQVKSAGVSLPNGRESGAWTWQQGISLGLRLSPRWTVETGLQRTAIRLQAERLLRFRYRINQEQFDQQRFLYQNSANDAMETAFGAVELRMDVGREPSRPIDDLTVFRIVLQTEEQARYWRVPLGLRWSAPVRGRWQWSLNGGVGFNFNAGYALGIKATSANRPGIRGISARRLGRAEGLAPFMADLQIGGRMSYRVSQRCSLSLTPEFRYGLTSMYRQGPFRSLAVSGGVTAGLNWQF